MLTKSKITQHFQQRLRLLTGEGQNKPVNHALIFYTYFLERGVAPIEVSYTHTPRKGTQVFVDGELYVEIPNSAKLGTVRTEAELTSSEVSRSFHSSTSLSGLGL